MALSSEKHEPFFVTTGTGKDKVATDDLTNITAAWAAEKAEGCKTYIADPTFGPIVYQLQQMQDEIDYLRTEISDNKDKTSMTLGTSSNTALAGDTNIVTIGSSTTIAFGDMITKTTVVKGKTVTTHTIVMTVTNGGVSKTITHTLT
tara:strand:- start:108 stop:548 length:441 start_codon:yes stop_codon:yes gene_type:complete